LIVFERRYYLTNHLFVQVHIYLDYRCPIIGKLCRLAVPHCGKTLENGGLFGIQQHRQVAAFSIILEKWRMKLA
jgi:hypothetical protein